LRFFSTRERITLVVMLLATGGTFLLRAAGANSVLAFMVSAVALAALASLVGDGAEQLGHRMGHGATGGLQSGLGNLVAAAVLRLPSAYCLLPTCPHPWAAGGVGGGRGRRRWISPCRRPGGR